MALALPARVCAETVGVFYDPAVEQIKIAAGDVKAALEKNKFTVEMLPVASLKASYPNKKVVIALASDATVTAALVAQGGSKVAGLGEQAYGLRTTETPQKSFWALGGDANGAMYGGFQIAENLKFNQFAGSYHNEESPAILKRGIKLNLPLDLNSATYFSASRVSDSAKQAIPHVWDMGFWAAWFDEMARNRYNVVSVWNNHPFTSMIKMADYPDVAIQNVTGYDGYSKVMSMDEKIDHWRKVMAYAHSRGFDFYLINWNIWTDGATGKYGITDDKEKATTNPATITYMRKCMTTLLETYPDLDGFGITQGEHMSGNKADEAAFLGNTYGKGMAEYAKRHPERKLRFIHRWHMADFPEIKKSFAGLMQLPNVTFDMSYKYSKAHMYATPVPGWMTDNEQNALRENGLKSWQTVRNDSLYFVHWGDPDFARAYLKGLPGQGDWFRGFLMGSDGFAPTKVFYSKNSATQGLLEVHRQWYLFMLWGRLAYNPATPDAVFKNHMALRFPEVSPEKLFAAWSKASRGLPKATDLVHGKMQLDFQWWPEGCQSQNGFVTAAMFAAADPGKGSTLCSIADSAANKCAGGKSSYALADEIEADALAALAIVAKMNSAPNTELGVTINSIKSMSYLSIYYACKIRGATHLKASDKEKARDALGTAYCWWMKYSNLMDSMFTGMKMQRTEDLPNWHVHDKSVLKEYTDLGGVGTPSCEENNSK
ncbi:MAG: hypothetical protein NTW21_24595 [Verrucomicrobia bacterium]|nr:hypothetical protein [Verrucomicrobiota bacterium]